MINIYNPYKAIFPVSPKAVVSVGDQVLSEYVFAFHGKESITGGFESLFSDIEFDYDKNSVTITPKLPIITASGYKLNNKEIFESIVKTLNGTRHVPISSSIIKIENEEKKLTVFFKKIPVNLKYLFTLPDFSIQKPNSEIINAEKNTNTTGPYYLEAVSETKVTLKSNPYFPESLTANKIDEVNLYHYQADQTNNLISSATPDTHHFLYLYGHSLNESMVNTLTQKTYKVNIHPNEWLVYLKFSERIPFANRVFISKLMEVVRNNSKNLSPYGQKTFSLAPSDRPYGLSENEYKNFLNNISNVKADRNLKFKIATLAHWDIPLFNVIKESILSNFKNAEFVTYQRSDYLKMIEESDICITMLGISPADPISHLSFLLETDHQLKKIVTNNDLNEISMTSDYKSFIEHNKKIERLIIQNQTYIPIANFPGVVAIAPQFELDNDLAWSWGIQSWTYHQR